VEHVTGSDHAIERQGLLADQRHVVEEPALEPQVDDLLVEPPVEIVERVSRA